MKIRLLLAGCLASVALLALASAAFGKTLRPTRTDDPAPNGCKKKDCSLREAVIAANAARGGKIVLRPGKRYVLTRRGAGEDAALTGDLDVYGLLEVTTKGRRGKMATIDARGIDRIFDGRPTDFGGVQIVPPNSPTLNRVILRGGHARATPGDPGNGGAVRGNPHLIDSRLIRNVADSRGGAVFFNRGPATIGKTIFKGNTAAGDGGAVYFLQVCQGGHEGNLSVGGSRATHNSAGGNGGAFFSYCSLELRRSHIGDNSARGPGGGIFSPGNTIPPDATTSNPGDWGSNVFMWQSTISANRSRYYGGGVAFDAGSSGSINNSTISGNDATGNGGGLGINAPAARAPVSLVVANSTLANNSTGEDGGGVGTNDSFDITGSHATMTLDHVTIARNQANTALVGGARRDGTGGGIFTSNRDGVSVHNSLLALNTAALAASNGPRHRASDCAGAPYHSLGHNLIGNPAGCLGFGAAGDLFGGKLKLGKLAKNGGPTKTIALQKGSRAIGHADQSAVPLSGRRDQRGFRWDRKPDIGAFDRGAKPLRARKKNR